MTEQMLEKFWAQVDKSQGDCWVWTGSKHHLGYGRPHFDGRSQYAHRISWELLNGPIPDGLSLDHLCRNPACVNPNHLEPVTHRENVLRGIGPTAVNATQTACPLGHSYSGTNLLVRPNGSRGCRACAVIANRNYWARKGATRDGAYSCDQCGWLFHNPKGVAAHKGRRHKKKADR